MTGFKIIVPNLCLSSAVKQPPVLTLEAAVFVSKVSARELWIRLHTQFGLIKTRYLVGF